MNLIPETFREFLCRHGVAWAFASFSPFEEKQVFGDAKLLESDDIVSHYFENICRLDQFLDGQILPNMVQQGNVVGIICRPTETVIVGLLYHDSRDVVQQYRHGKKLDEELRALWAADKSKVKPRSSSLVT